MKKNSENTPENGQPNTKSDARDTSNEPAFKEDLLDDPKEKRKKLFQFLMMMLSSEEGE